MSTTTHSHEFKAEIKQLLELLIHSVYTSKDIFVRELISNGADALEKARFLKAAGRPLHSPDEPLEIRLETRTENDRKILVISDTGVGMTADEVHTNIGTIAHSGATAFLEQLGREAQADPKQGLSLIGRFGVGFYSVFMAAEKVVLTTRSANPEGQTVVWTSDGLGSYTLETLAEEHPRGTQIEIHLRKDDEQFADEFKLKAAIKRYSNFVPFPILVNGEQVNQTSALSREPASQVTDEQYNAFFQLISHDATNPLARLHFAADAPLQYSALLFIPTSNPESMGFGRGEVSLELYVKRVLIDGENKNLLPAYLRFAKGVVESDDLPLNVSRETLQENRLVAKIRDGLTRKLLDLLSEMAKDKPDDYRRFWETFGRIFREGYTDFAHRDKFQELLRFNSSRHENAQDLISLADYVAAMPAEQKAIYYLSGPSREALLRDARLELLRKKGVEVLYLYDLADEFILDNFDKYKDKPLVSADQVKTEDLAELGDKSQPEPPAAEQSDIGLLVARFKEILGDRVIDVRGSERLVDSPACLVAEDSQMSVHMDKMMRMMNKNAELPKRVMELNPRHSLVRNLARLVERDKDDPFVARAADAIVRGGDAGRRLPIGPARVAGTDEPDPG